VSSDEGLEPIALEPFVSVRVTTLVDNVTDTPLSDQGPAGRSNSRLFVNHVALEPTRHREPARPNPTDSDGVMRRQNQQQLAPIGPGGAWRSTRGGM
jgi:hypothetical protein